MFYKTSSYNSNHIEGSRLTHDQTRFIFETNTIGISESAVNVDDIIETTNHFRAIDYLIDNTEDRLSETLIKHLHFLLKSGTSDERISWFRIGDYKKLPNEVGGEDTAAPEDVHAELSALIKDYNSKKTPSFEEIIDFHHRFEKIHPFQDGNGRVGRLIMFRECLRLGYVPFIITDELKMFYYNGLRNSQLVGNKRIPSRHLPDGSGRFQSAPYQVPNTCRGAMISPGQITGR